MNKERLVTWVMVFSLAGLLFFEGKIRFSTFTINFNYFVVGLVFCVLSLIIIAACLNNSFMVKLYVLMFFLTAIWHIYGGTVWVIDLYHDWRKMTSIDLYVWTLYFIITVAMALCYLYPKFSDEYTKYKTAREAKQQAKLKQQLKTMKEKKEHIEVVKARADPKGIKSGTAGADPQYIAVPDDGKPGQEDERLLELPPLIIFPPLLPATRDQVARYPATQMIEYTRANPKAQLLKECPLCSTAYLEREMLVIQNSCGHYFHPDCLWQWEQAMKKQCPICAQEPEQADEEDLAHLMANLI